MPEEIEVETKDLQETIDEIREEREARSQEAKENEWTRYISLSTAILAVVAALASLQAGKLINDALLKKNESVLSQARASDQWSYYQAAGIKANASRQSADLLIFFPNGGKRAEFWRSEAVRYDQKKQMASDDAKGFESQRDEFAEESKLLLSNHEVFALCVTFTQVAIALSAIAALRKSRLVWYFSLLAGAIGLAMLFLGYSRSVRSASLPPSEPSRHAEKVATKPGSA